MMQAVFVELPAFQKNRSSYLDDEEFQELQSLLLETPDTGEVITGTGGLRKVRFADKRRQKGKRGGIRIIYYYWVGGLQFWLFTLYDKDEADDLTEDQKKILKKLLTSEIEVRTKNEQK